MGRHFLGLYSLILLTLAVVSWGQDKLLQRYGVLESPDERSLALNMFLLQDKLHERPASEWKRIIAAASLKSGLNMEVFTRADIAGRQTLAKLDTGEIAHMRASTDESWTLKELDADHVLALKVSNGETHRGALDWTLTLLFYAAIALVLMIWIWPLTRDLRSLESAAAKFGDGNWLFEARIKPQSQIYPLAETFRKMAARIDALIASHKDMSNAVSHEIKTPLARMQFEIEMAQRARTPADLAESLDHIKTDIAAIDDLVTATLSYAILERAGLALNLGTHDFRIFLPSIAESVQRDAASGIRICSEVPGYADAVVCDAHLLETAVKNLLYNAVRYAKREIRLSFSAIDGANHLLVDDDGPGIPEKDRERVMNSFVQLDRGEQVKQGFGLGLAIVKRVMDWHGGDVKITKSPLGGARIAASWPIIGKAESSLA